MVRQVNENTEPAISTNNLSISYRAHGGGTGHTAIDGLTFSVQKGEILSILGETGSGKTTLAKVLSGNASMNGRWLGKPRITAGTAMVLGNQLKHIFGRSLRHLTCTASFLPHDAGERLTPTLTAGELIAEPILSRDRNYNQRELGIRVATLIDKVQLPLSTVDKYPYELSNGQRQRVAVARSLVLEPSLFIADEPTAGIDATVRHLVVDLLQELSGAGDFTAVIISSDLAIVRKISTSVAVLVGGCLVAHGSLDDVLSQCQHSYVKNLASLFTEGSETSQRCNAEPFPENLPIPQFV